MIKHKGHEGLKEKTFVPFAVQKCFYLATSTIALP